MSELTLQEHASRTSLEQAYAARDLQLQYLGAKPDYDPLRRDPRFQNLMRRIGLEP